MTSLPIANGSLKRNSNGDGVHSFGAVAGNRQATFELEGRWRHNLSDQSVGAFIKRSI